MIVFYSFKSQKKRKIKNICPSIVVFTFNYVVIVFVIGFQFVVFVVGFQFVVFFNFIVSLSFSMFYVIILPLFFKKHYGALHSQFKKTKVNNGGCNFKLLLLFHSYIESSIIIYQIEDRFDSAKHTEERI